MEGNRVGRRFRRSGLEGKGWEVGTGIGGNETAHARFVDQSTRRDYRIVEDRVDVASYPVLYRVDVLCLVSSTAPESRH